MNKKEKSVKEKANHASSPVKVKPVPRTNLKSGKPVNKDGDIMDVLSNYRFV